MKNIIHERPGVYSSYDASATVRGGRAVRTIGVAAKSVSGTANEAVRLTSYEMGVSAFGEDAAGVPGMSTILKLLFLGGASAVAAVRVDGEDYAEAFAALQAVEDVQILVCDSGELTVQQALRSSLESASAARRERIAVVGMNGASTVELTERAKALNSERMVLVGPDGLDSAGNALSGVFAAAAVAAAVAITRDPAIPLNGTQLPGLGGVSTAYSDNEIDMLVRGGVTPLEAVGGIVSPVRGITTRTTTGGADDTTWRELTTILIVDDVIPTIRQSLRSRFSQTKNTAQTRGAIRSQTIVELENKLRAEIIDSYSDVTVSVYEDDPTVCLVEFSFAVAHGLNQIYLTAHITI
ncbi:MAG: phage tail sheath subtilisin-like domain-containing protein [Oscillospiraceae bacterium]|nr:phage tail sheath subtilisin-like domain-containing protein [Oscillospiraceae bacterium]